jgi:hypothetical protein
MGAGEAVGFANFIKANGQEGQKIFAVPAAPSHRA